MRQDMSMREDIARAKVNLTLEILGRRPDGYHALRSLVAFAHFGDGLSLNPGKVFSLSVDGPFAAALEGGNLIQTAAQLYAHAASASDAATAEPVGAFRLTKRIPVAAGLGGGSADAAAALRLLAGLPSEAPRLSAPEPPSRHYEELPRKREDEAIHPQARRLSVDCFTPASPGFAGDERAGDRASIHHALMPLAAKLGADVPACLFSKPAIMTGIGERLHFLSRFPAVPIVLVNPRLPLVPLATAAVFGELRAAPVQATPELDAPAEFAGLDDLTAYARQSRNDLEPPARRLLPIIGAILDRLEACPGARLARLSGSGPTCFALFRTRQEAEAAASALRAEHPDWWIEATTLAP
jgi:4-diphosphocytidyl-2-C-methyl-D-erythritol kinase